MAEDWKPGDLALCVRGGYVGGIPTFEYPRAGAVYTVISIERGYKFNCGTIGTHLILDGAPPNVSGVTGWVDYRFRKINPHTPDAEDEETIRLLNGVNAYRGVS